MTDAGRCLQASRFILRKAPTGDFPKTRNPSNPLHCDAFGKGADDLCPIASRFHFVCLSLRANQAGLEKTTSFMLT